MSNTAATYDSALVGYTGFVGGNILSQHHFTHLYDAENIEKIQGKDFNMIVCAAAPGTKWVANKNPADDLTGIQKLISNLENVSAQKFVLISTIDVYCPVNGVDEDTIINKDALQPYGKHRRMLEEYVAGKFDSLIIRLPGIFGDGLKKNIIFDLIHGNYQPINNSSYFQFYLLDHIWSDIQRCLDNNLRVVNFSTEPVTVKELTDKIFNLNFPDVNQPPVQYDMHTKYALLWGNSGPYLYHKNAVLADIKFFVDRTK